MDKTLVTNVVIKLDDQLSAGVKGAVDKSKGHLESFGAQAEKVGRAMESIGTRVGAIGGALQMGLSRLDLDMASVATASISAEKALFSIATTAGKSGEEARASVAAWGQVINEVAVASNQAQAEVITAFQDLIAKGMTDADAVKMLEPIGRAATAAGANIRDIASSANAAFQNLGIAPERLSKALDIMAQAGKSGAFELRDMAQYFDALTVKSALLGQKGEAALGQLAAAAQIARKGAGDASTAANNLANFLDKLSAPVTAGNFEKIGINLAEEVKKGIASGDLIGYIGELVARTTQGDAQKLSALFSDVQAKNFIAPLIQNLEEYKRIRDESLSATGVVARDFDTSMQSMAATFDRLKIAGQSAFASSEVVKQLLSGLTSLADWAAANPNVVAILGIGSAAALAGGAVVAGIGAIVTSIGAMATALGGLSAFLAANPVVLTILGVGAAAVVGWKFGGFIAEQVDLVVQKLTGSGSLGVLIFDTVQRVTEAFDSLPKLLKERFDALLSYLRDMPKRFADIGRNAIQGLIDGVKAKAGEVMQAAKDLAGSLPAWVRKALDMRSPSKVMEDLGRMAAAGFVIGITAGAPSVADAAGQLAAQAALGASGGVLGGEGVSAQAQAYLEAEQRETEHQQRMMQIKSFFSSQALQNSIRYNKMNLDSSAFFFGQLGALMQTKSRALFEIGKVGAIGETIISTYVGAQKAYAAMAGIPYVGPALGVAAAAAAVLAGMARVAAIRSTSFGSASGSPVLSSGGFSGPVVAGDSGVVPFESPAARQQRQQPTQTVNLYLSGDGSPTQSYIRDVLVPGLNEALGAGVTLNVRTA